MYKSCCCDTISWWLRLGYSQAINCSWNCYSEVLYGGQKWTNTSLFPGIFQRNQHARNNGNNTDKCINYKFSKAMCCHPDPGIANWMAKRSWCCHTLYLPISKPPPPGGLPWYPKLRRMVGLPVPLNRCAKLMWTKSQLTVVQSQKAVAVWLSQTMLPGISIVTKQKEKPKRQKATVWGMKWSMCSNLTSTYQYSIMACIFVKKRISSTKRASCVLAGAQFANW